jgi:hypothetical protein
MTDYSPNMTLGEKWEMREKLRMAKVFRTSFPFEEHRIIVNNVSHGEFACSLDLEISGSNVKLASMLDLYKLC